MQRKTLLAVVVTRNRLSLLQGCLARLADVSPADVSAIVVVDNASTDGTGDWLSGLDMPRLRSVLLRENQGGAGGFAQGIAYARAQFDPDWIVVFDDDAVPEPDMFRQFHTNTRCAHKTYCAAVFDQNGQVAPLNRPFYNPFTSVKRFAASLMRGARGYSLPESAFAYRHQKQVTYATFVGMFLSRQTITKLGLPDAKWFLYCDDLAYCARHRGAGVPIIFDPSLRFRHFCETFQKGYRIYDPIWKVFYAYRNGLIFARQEAGKWAAPVACGLILFWALRAVRYRGQRRPYLRLLGAAVRDGLTQSFSRAHTDILRIAAQTTGCPTRSNASPKAVKAKANPMI